jgi:hypothetical protein
LIFAAGCSLFCAGMCAERWRAERVMRERYWAVPLEGQIYYGTGKWEWVLQGNRRCWWFTPDNPPQKYIPPTLPKVERKSLTDREMRLLEEAKERTKGGGKRRVANPT